MTSTKNSSNGGLSDDTKTLITVLLLVFVYPVGLIMMFVWMKWRWWVKLLVAFPVTLGILAFVAMGMLIALNPAEQIRKANCVKVCDGNDSCVQTCVREKDMTVSAPSELTPTKTSVVTKTPVIPQKVAK